MADVAGGLNSGMIEGFGDASRDASHQGNEQKGVTEAFSDGSRDVSRPGDQASWGTGGGTIKRIIISPEL
jgi:hypothetical protein